MPQTTPAPIARESGGPSPARVSIDDLNFAANWMATYEGSDEVEDEDDNSERVQRILAWLGAEVVRRERDAMVRRAAKKHGVSAAAVRKAMARRASAGAAQ